MAIVLVVLFTAFLGVAADRRSPEQQIELLQKRILSLEKELAVLKSAIEITDGTMRLTIKKEKREAIGANDLSRLAPTVSTGLAGRARKTSGPIGRSQWERTKSRKSARTCHCKWGVIRASSRDRISIQAPGNSS